jgi:hypothetical protein
MRSHCHMLEPSGFSISFGLKRLATDAMMAVMRDCFSKSALCLAWCLSWLQRIQSSSCCAFILAKMRAMSDEPSGGGWRSLGGDGARVCWACYVLLQLSAEEPVIQGMKLLVCCTDSPRRACLPLAWLSLDGWPGPGIQSTASLIDLPPDQWKGLLPEKVQVGPRPNQARSACELGVRRCTAAVASRTCFSGGSIPYLLYLGFVGGIRHWSSGNGVRM